MTNIFDSHAHYDDGWFDSDRDELLASLPDKGVCGIVNNSVDLNNAKTVLALAEKYPFIYAAVGIHPENLEGLPEDYLDRIAALTKHPKVVAIGETGLDYHWDVWPREIQKEWFARQMELAIKVGLPINVHSRDAAQDTFDLIRQEHAGTTGGIIHCFSGSAELAREYVKMGYFLGIGGVATFKNSKVLKRVIAETPLPYLVTETDSPYVAPSPHRGQRNDPGYIPLVIEAIAKIKEISIGEAADALLRNAQRAYPRLAGRV